MKVWVALKDHLHHGDHQLLFLSVTLMEKTWLHLVLIMDRGDFKTQMCNWLKRCFKKRKEKSVCVRERSDRPMDWSVCPMVSLALTRVEYNWSRGRDKETKRGEKDKSFLQACLHQLPLLGWFLFHWHRLSKNVIVFLSEVLQADGPPCPLEKGNFTSGVGIFSHWQRHSDSPPCVSCFSSQ